jgi:hypothetical protein
VATHWSAGLDCSGSASVSPTTNDGTTSDVVANAATRLRPKLRRRSPYSLTSGTRMIPARRATTSMEGPIVLPQRGNTKQSYGVDVFLTPSE